MTNKKYYYLALPTHPFTDISDVYDDVEDGFYDKVDQKYLKSQGIEFLCNDSEENAMIYSSKINGHGVMKFFKLSNIFDFLFDAFFMEFKQEVTDYIQYNKGNVFDDGVDETYLSKIFDNFLVIRTDKNMKELSIVKKREIEDCYYQVAIGSQDKFFEKIQNNILFETSDVVRRFDVKFREFTNKLEYLIGNNPSSHIQLSADNNSDFSIFKKDCNFHKNFKKHSKLLDETPSENGFIYEWPISSFRHYILRNIINQKPIGCTFRVYLSEYNKKTKELPFSKVYGFMILPAMEDVVDFQQIDAQMVLDSFLTDVSTGQKTLKPDAKTIYCGADETDEICGFELI